jgi:hypothetical protein
LCLDALCHVSDQKDHIDHLRVANDDACTSDRGVTRAVDTRKLYLVVPEPCNTLLRSDLASSLLQRRAGTYKYIAYQPNAIHKAALNRYLSLTSLTATNIQPSYNAQNSELCVFSNAPCTNASSLFRTLNAHIHGHDITNGKY